MYICVCKIIVFGNPEETPKTGKMGNNTTKALSTCYTCKRVKVDVSELWQCCLTVIGLRVDGSETEVLPEQSHRGVLSSRGAVSPSNTRTIFVRKHRVIYLHPWQHKTTCQNMAGACNKHTAIIPLPQQRPTHKPQHWIWLELDTDTKSGSYPTMQSSCGGTKWYQLAGCQKLRPRGCLTQ